MLQVAKPEGQIQLRLLELDRELQDLEFALLDFILDLVKYFLIIPLGNGNIYSV